MSGKKQILDPLSCLCKIGMLSYYPEGTKISIIDNIICLQEPDNVQWIKRKYYGDEKNDISTLYNPVLKAIEWYILQSESVINNIETQIMSPPLENIIMDEVFIEKEMPIDLGILQEIAGDDRKLSDSSESSLQSNVHMVDKITLIKNIMSHAVNGLSKLQKTYGDGNVILAIQFLKNNIKMALKDNYTVDIFNEINEIDCPKENILNYEKMKSIWKYEKIKIVSGQFDLLDKNSNANLEYLIKSMKSTLMDTDTKFKELVKSMNTSL